MTLKAVDPIDITEAVLTASDIPEPDIASGEFEWEDESSRKLVLSTLYPAGYDSITGPVVYDDKHPVCRYYIPVVDTSSGDYAIARYSNDLSLVDVYPISLGISPGDFSMVGFNYVDSLDVFFVFWRNELSPFQVARQTYPELNKTVSTGFNPFTILDQVPTELNEDGNTLLSMAYVSQEVIAACYQLAYSTGTSNVVRLKTFDGSLISESSRSTFGKISTDGENLYVWDNPTTRLIVDVYDSDLSIIESKSLERSVNDFVGVGTSSGIHALTGRTGTDIYIEPISYNFINAGSYKKDDEVIVSSVHRKYRCLVSETFDYPLDGATEDASATWIDIGPTNKWAMFDEKTTTSTIDGTSFSMTFNPVNYVNAMAFFNVAGTESINITVKDAGGTERYNENFALLDISPIYDYYTYFFYQNTSNDELVADDLPPYYDPEITVTFTGSAISVGAMVMGFANQIGTALTDTQTDTLDYSRQEYDEFGELTYIERPVVKLNTYEVLADKTINPYIQNLIKKLRGKNTLWIGDIGGGQKLITYGRYERSPIPFTMPNDVRYSITVRGSI